MRGKVGVILGVFAVAVGVASLALHQRTVRAAEAKRLIGDDFGRMRREALDLFPRGLPVMEATDGLKAIGFQCTPAHRLLANVNAPSVQCDSAGRGFPVAPRMQVTVMSRNGALSDIAIGSGVDGLVADARTPDPDITGSLGPRAPMH